MALCPALSHGKPMSRLWQLQPEGSVPQRHRLLLRKGGKGPKAGGILCTWDADAESSPTAENKCSLPQSACQGVNQTSLLAVLRMYSVFK